MCFKCFPVHRNLNKSVSLLVVIQDENKAKIQSILEHLCGENRMLEIYQKDHTDEMIISGACVKGLSSCQVSIKNAKQCSKRLNIISLAVCEIILRL